MARMETFHLLRDKGCERHYSAKGDVDTYSEGIGCEIVSWRMFLLASTRFPSRF